VLVSAGRTRAARWARAYLQLRREASGPRRGNGKGGKDCAAGPEPRTVGGTRTATGLREARELPHRRPLPDAARAGSPFLAGSALGVFETNPAARPIVRYATAPQADHTLPRDDDGMTPSSAGGSCCVHTRLGTAGYSNPDLAEPLLAVYSTTTVHYQWHFQVMNKRIQSCDDGLIRLGQLAVPIC
jgi:hypothetical protein